MISCLPVCIRVQGASISTPCTLQGVPISRSPFDVASLGSLKPAPAAGDGGGHEREVLVSLSTASTFNEQVLCILPSPVLCRCASHHALGVAASTSTCEFTSQRRPWRKSGGLARLSGRPLQPPSSSLHGYSPPGLSQTLAIATASSLDSTVLLRALYVR